MERHTRKVIINEIELLSEELTFEGSDIQFKIRVKCGKGTYIRTLAVQIGELLGYPAHMASLVRTMSGSYVQEECFTLAELESVKSEGNLQTCLRPVETALKEFPFIEVDEEIYVKIKNGQVLPAHSELEIASKLVFTKNARALAVYIKHPTKTGLMKPEKMFPIEE